MTAPRSGRQNSTSDEPEPFVVRVRNRLAPAKSAKAYRHTDPERALERALKAPVVPPDAVMTWESDRLVALDIDAPDDGPLPKDYDVAILFPPWLPRPVAAWRTHGGGIRAIFGETELRTSAGQPVATLDAIESAGGWYALAELSAVGTWSVELKNDSRHPKSTRPDGGECGPVTWFGRSPCTIDLRRARVLGREVDPADVHSWCAARGVPFGRYTTDQCPLPACALTRRTSGNPPIVVSETGMQCFRCNRRASWPQILGAGVDSGMVDAAERLVHVEHQIYVLRARRPGAPDELLRAAWKVALLGAHAAAIVAEREEADDEDDGVLARVDSAATSGRHAIVRGSDGQWLQPGTLVPRTTITGRTIKPLPWARRAEQVDEAQDVVALAGFTPVFAVNAGLVLPPYFTPPSGTVLARRAAAADEPPPPDLARVPTPEAVEGAWTTLERMLPGLRREYLLSLLAVGLHAQHGRGQPPCLIVTGRTGAAKTATIRVAAAALGTTAASVKLDESRVTARDIGLALEKGAGFILVDEIGRARDPFQRLDALLKLGETVRYDAKFRNEIERPMNAAIVIAGSSLPFAVTRSPELARRSLGLRLVEQASGWEKLYLHRIRHDDGVRLALDTITAHVWHLLHAEGPDARWRSLARKLGASELTDLDLDDVSPETRAAVIREAYEYWRTADVTAFYRGGGHEIDWIDLDMAKSLRTSLETIVEVGEHANASIQHAQFEDLKKVDLAPVLGFDKPYLEMIIRRRSAKLLLKFIQRAAQRGREIPRAELPPPSPAPDGAPRARPLISMRAALQTHVSAAGVVVSSQPAAQPDAPGVPPAESNVAPSSPRIAVAFDVTNVAPGVDQVRGAAVVSADGEVLWRRHEPVPTLVVQAASDGRVFVRDWHGVGRRAWQALGWPIPRDLVDLSKLERATAHRLEELRSQLRHDGSAQHEARAVYAARARSWPLHESERDVMTADRRINERGFRIDRALARALYDVASTLNDRLSTRAGVSQAALRNGTAFVHSLAKAGGPRVPDLRRKTLEEVLSDDSLPYAAARLIEARIGVASSTIARARAALHHADADDRVRDTLLYFGAHPGRWSARGFPAHNQPRVGVRAAEVTDAVLARDVDTILGIAEGEQRSVTSLLTGIVRNLIVAPPESELIIADFRSFEPRTLRWLVRDDDGVADYTHAEPYRMRARDMFGHDDVDDVTASEQALAKLGEIGAAYGMGADTLERYGRDQGIEWTAMRLDPAELIEVWRARNPLIVDLWHRIDAAVRSAASGSKFDDRVGRLKLTVPEGARMLAVRLPSGRIMQYREVREVEREGGVAYEADARGRRRLWGGSVTQNITEAVTRDILASVLVRAEAASIATVLHVHDEVVAEGGAHEEKKLVEIMITPPRWAPELPLAVKYARRGRYGE